MNAPYTEGPFDAKICFIGEAPGENEVAEQRPFVGKAGVHLNSLLHSAGIIRTECRLENVLQFRPKNNDITPYIKIGTKNVTTSSEFDEQVLALKERLEFCTANVFVPLGNVPLYALTELTKITKRRGSILRSTLLPGRKVIPTIHPSAALRPFGATTFYNYFIIHDLKRILKQSEFPEIDLPARNLITDVPFLAVLDYINSCHEMDIIGVDLETHGNGVSHIALARTPSDCMCIPLFDTVDNYTPEQESTIWSLVGELMEDESVIKVGHHITFDATMLFTRFGIVTDPVEDTMIGFAILYPDFPKGLDFVVSTYCSGEPYYKDEGKRWFRLEGSVEEFRRYNAKDAALCLEAWLRIESDLEKSGNLNVYQNQRNLVQPLVFMQSKGILMDAEGMQRESVNCTEKIASMEKELKEIVGYDLNINSPQQVANYFYIEKKLPPYTKKGAITVDAKALTRIARKGFKEASLITSIRHLSKMKSTYFETTLEDDRLKCSYNPVGTEQGRISSSKTIFGTGGNLQNQPPEMKSLMLADPDNVLINIDLSQAENRVTAYVANEYTMIEAFEEGIDIHSRTASLIYNVPIEQVSDEEGSANIPNSPLSQRDMGKKCNHALNYNMGYKEFALQTEIAEFDAKKLVEYYHRVYPGIRQWHEVIRHQVRKDRTLVNCYDRTRRFMGSISSEMFNVAFSYIPQSTVADKLNRDGIQPIYNNNRFSLFELLNTVHDSIVLQVDYKYHSASEILNRLWELKQVLEEPLEWKGREFIIPCDMKVGKSLGKTIELDPINDNDKAYIILLEVINNGS